MNPKKKELELVNCIFFVQNNQRKRRLRFLVFTSSNVRSKNRERILEINRAKARSLEVTNVLTASKKITYPTIKEAALGLNVHLNTVKRALKRKSLIRKIYNITDIK